MGRLEATISAAALILRRVTLIGSLGGTTADVESVYRSFATGQVTPTLAEITFAQIPEGLARLQRGEVVGRLVAKIAD
jgi:alcohol dehydrogenase, propanol-preferring